MAAGLEPVTYPHPFLEVLRLKSLIRFEWVTSFTVQVSNALSSDDGDVWEAMELLGDRASLEEASHHDWVLEKVHIYLTWLFAVRLPDS